MRDFLQRHKLLQEDMATILGISTRMIQMYCAGRRPPQSVRLILEAVDEGKLTFNWLARKLEPKQ